MRIGINSLYLIPGGVGGTESYLRNLIRLLEECAPDDEFVVFTNQENAGTFDLRAANFREVPTGVAAVSRPKRILYEQLSLPRLCKKEGIDVLHSPGYTAPIFAGVPSVVTIHDLNYHYFPEDWSRSALWANRILIPRVARGATRVITDSFSSERAIHEILRVPKDRIDVVHLGVDGNLTPRLPTEEADARARYQLDGPFLLSVTASHPHKNLDGLLRAYEAACAGWSQPPPLVIVGIKGRHQDELERALKEKKSPGRVVLTGWIDAPVLGALYRAAHLFVFPSKYEGFGFPVLEAMSAGVPVVSSNATSLPELVGEAGVQVDPNDAAGMGAAIRRTWQDDQLRRDLIARGAERVATFTWRRAAEKTLASYRRASLGATMRA